jgi:hypothetical protein
MQVPAPLRHVGLVAGVLLLSGCVLLPRDTGPTDNQTVVAGPAVVRSAIPTSAPIDARVRCVLEAAHPDDPSLGSTYGVGFDDIDLEQARLACEAARERWPHDVQVAFHLSRVLRRAGDRRWEELLSVAATGGVPVARFVMAASRAGNDWDLPQASWPRDRALARADYLAAVEAGVTAAIADLVPIVAFGLDGTAPDREAAETLLLRRTPDEHLFASNTRAWMRALHRVNLSDTLELADRNLELARTSSDARHRDLLPPLIDTRARVLLELGRMLEAEQTQHEAIRLAQQNGQTDVCMEIQLGLILMRAGKPEGAAQVWRGAEARLADPNVRGASEAICPETFAGPFAINFVRR